MSKTVQVERLVNPARCMGCKDSADWWVTVGDDDDYESFYYCDDCLPKPLRDEIEE